MDHWRQNCRPVQHTGERWGPGTFEACLQPVYHEYGENRAWHQIQCWSVQNSQYTQPERRQTILFESWPKSKLSSAKLKANSSFHLYKWLPNSVATQVPNIIRLVKIYCPLPHLWKLAKATAHLQLLYIRSKLQNVPVVSWTDIRNVLKPVDIFPESIYIKS